ncbi:MAG: efflux transporter periplasmic adaptor subunit [Blastopirellula sp.]|nr:MAG: efflux transporter periplasmic adaptor subunit [Blastopirellula sp.]
MNCASISNNSHALRRQRKGFIGRALIGVMVLASISVGAYFTLGSFGSDEQDTEILYYTVSSGPFLHNVVERGEVESANNRDVKSQAKGYRSSTSYFKVLEVIEEGAIVEEGQVLVLLDSAALRDELVRQELDVIQSQASLSKAENELAAAEIALKEYELGLFLTERRKLKAAETLAEENLRRAKEYYIYSSRLAAKGFVTSLQLEGDRFAVDKSTIELEKAIQELKVLEEYTKFKKMKGLESDINVATASLEAARERLLLEKKMVADFKREIDHCTIVAPQAGQVVHANVKSSRGDSEFILEPGANVREGQTLIRLPDYTAMQVVCKINESRIEMIKVGMPVTIRLDAYDDLELTGEVTKVSEYPEPVSYYSSPIKKYATTIKIDSSSNTIRPGLTSQVTIHVESSPDELQVPVQAIYQHAGTYYCILKNSAGVEAREVKIGSSNSKFVVIKEGITANDRVARNPRNFLDQVDLPEVDFQKEEMIAKHAKLDQQKRAKRGRNVSTEEKKKPVSPSAKAVLPSTEAVSPTAKAAIDRLFTRFDKDADGVLSSEELSSKDAQPFSNADADGNGTVERKEFDISVLQLANSTDDKGGNLQRNGRSQGASAGGGQ